MKFRLRISQHIQTDPHTKKQTVYKAGDVFDCDEDLVAKFGSEKFQRIDFKEPAPQAVAPTSKSDVPDFHLMTVDQLKKYAEAEEIDLGKAVTKDAIIKVLHAELQPA